MGSSRPTQQDWATRLTRVDVAAPAEQHEALLPDLTPGTTARVSLGIGQPLPARVQAEVVRPTGFSARSAVKTT